MKLLSFSGAATKLAAHAAHGKIILDKQNYKPNIVAGVSSGSLVILPMLLGKHKQLEEISTSLNLDYIFDVVPVNKNGKITAEGIVSAVFTGSLGSMKHLELLLRRFVTKKEYNKLITSLGCPIVYVGVTNITYDRFELLKLNEFSYEDAIKIIMASCSIPIYSNPIRIGESLYFDGGLKQHNPASEVIRKYGKRIKECVSVYSRPENNEIIDFGYSGHSLGRTFSKVIDCFQTGISNENQKIEKELSEIYGIRLTQRFSPSILKGLYDVDNTRLRKLYDAVISNN